MPDDTAVVVKDGEDPEAEVGSGLHGEAAGSPEDARSKEVAKRTVALHVAYVGTGYKKGEVAMLAGSPNLALTRSPLLCMQAPQ